MKKIGLIVAMDKEFNLLKGLMTEPKEVQCGNLEIVEGNIGGKDVFLAHSGIGKVCAAVGVLEMIKNFAPDAIINSGVAGGIDVKTQVMDVVAGENVVYHDVWCGEPNMYGQVQGMPASYAGDRKILDAVTSLEAEANIYAGQICSGDKFITERKELDEIKAKFPQGLAVDMESAAMAQVCYMYKVPFLSLRIISDTPGVKDHQKQYENFWEEAPKKSLDVVANLLAKL